MPPERTINRINPSIGYILVVLTAVVLFTGCSTQTLTEQDKAHYAKCEPKTECAPRPHIPEASLFPSKEQELRLDGDEENDRAICKREAMMAAGCSQTGYSLYGLRFNDVSKTHKQKRIFEGCMKSKGHE
jgi:hypothetical protein